MKKSFWCGLTAGIFVGYYICEYKDEIKEVITETKEKIDDFLEESGMVSLCSKAFDRFNFIKEKAFDENIVINELGNFSNNHLAFEKEENAEEEIAASAEQYTDSEDLSLEDAVPEESETALNNESDQNVVSESSVGMIFGNSNSMVCHKADCRYAPKKSEITAIFETIEKAEAAGYKKCSRCLEA